MIYVDKTISTVFEHHLQSIERSRAHIGKLLERTEDFDGYRKVSRVLDTLEAIIKEHRRLVNEEEE